MTTSDPLPVPDHLVLFDGVCNLCNSLVRFILRHDRRKRFRFAPLRSATGRRLLNVPRGSAPGLDSLVYWRKGRMLTRSTAALHVARDLDGAWPLAYAFIAVPRLVRDALYDLVARNRYRWFGKRDACMVPTPELADRFLD